MPLRTDFNRGAIVDPTRNLQEAFKGAGGILDTIAAEEFAKKKQEDSLKQQAFQNSLAQAAEDRAKSEYERKLAERQAEDIFYKTLRTGPQAKDAWLTEVVARGKQPNLEDIVIDPAKQYTPEELTRRTKAQEALGAAASNRDMYEDRTQLLERAAANAGLPTETINKATDAQRAADLAAQQAKQKALSDQLANLSEKDKELYLQGAKNEADFYNKLALKGDKKYSYGSGGSRLGKEGYTPEDWVNSQQEDMKKVTLLGANVGDAEDVGNAYDEGKKIGAPLVVVKNAVSKMTDPAFWDTSVPPEKQMRDAVNVEYELYKKRKGLNEEEGSSTTTYGDYNPMLRKAIEAQRAGLQGERSNLLNQQALLNMSPEERDRLKADQILQSVLGGRKQAKPNTKVATSKSKKSGKKDSTSALSSLDVISNDLKLGKPSVEQLMKTDKGLSIINDLYKKENRKSSIVPVPKKKQNETKKPDVWLDKVPKVTNALGERVSSGKSPRDIIKENKQLFNEIKRYDNSLSDKEAYDRLLLLLR